MSSLPEATTPSFDWRRPLRYLWRVPLLLLHALVGLPITLAMINPLCARISLRGERLDHWVIRIWSAGLLRVFGLRSRRYGTPLPGAALFVANHVSWIDIELMHSQRMMGFVAKAEIASWPLIGWVASRGGTIYHHRGSNDSLHGVMHQMVERLQSGQAVGVFPEGRTTRGDSIGVFHARIFQPAVLAGVPAQPVALKYGNGGDAQTIIAFADRESFAANIFRLLGEPGRVAEVHFLEPVAASEDGRRRLADTCRERIIAAMAL
ncbi:MAG TPA: lysophospholipid acyltransferase family protein [Arenimonas sp.]|uniref:lysophospholipid acyltransferase family protein n=1 Tax=Arenimonas sp. TaxID=1872635 RepID=UPI002C9E6077|nr:lysophospholipid acyltransferase family protein [Arenimonas sp.]HMB57349.1 lysophospholipid acyltransferase family protein [Arenimonas sp.]